MTSLVDVTFVLLIIFIISAPFLRSGIEVELPQATTREAQPHRSILITVDRSGQVYVNNDKTEVHTVGMKVKGLLAQTPGLPVLIEGDRASQYGNVVTVMDALRETGIENVGLVLETVTTKSN